MFTQWAKIKVWGPDGIGIIYYDGLSSIDSWYLFCMNELSIGRIKGFTLTTTKA